MKKTHYIVPETICDYYEIESLLCQSVDGSIEDLIPSNDEFDMF